MVQPKIRRKRAELVMIQMPLDMWIDFTALAEDSNLTRRELSAFLREARKRGFVKYKLEERTFRPLWKRIGPIANF